VCLCIHWVVQNTKQHPFLIHAGTVFIFFCLHYLRFFAFFSFFLWSQDPNDLAWQSEALAAYVVLVPFLLVG
jgi:hypothetical protein